MFKTILIPFDGSVGGEQALLKAAELAVLCKAEVIVLTVFRHHSMLEASFSMVRASDPGTIDAAMQQHAKEVAEQAKNDAVAGRRRKGAAHSSRRASRRGPSSASPGNTDMRPAS